jgi:hypothetical protein
MSQEPVPTPNDQPPLTFRNEKENFAMNRAMYQAKEDFMLSRTFLFGTLQRAIVAVALLVSIPATAVAQYGSGGTGATPTYPGGTHPSYGSKGAVIGGVVAGAAVGAGLLYWKFHNRTKLQGCVAGDGDRLVNEKDNQTYNLTNKQNKSLKPGERVELLGAKAKDRSGEPTFVVHKMSKDLGQCTATTAEQR